MKKLLIWVLAGLGLGTFFLPLARVQAPLVGTQKVSLWDLVQPQEKKQGWTDKQLGKLTESVLQKAQRDAPLAVKQAYALVVTLPLAYLSFVLAAILAALARALALRISAGVGFLAGAYSLVSVYWLNTGLRQTVAGGGSRVPGMDWLRGKAAAGVSVSPEIGLYLLAGALAALLLASFLPGPKR